MSGNGNDRGVIEGYIPPGTRRRGDARQSSSTSPTRSRTSSKSEIGLCGQRAVRRRAAVTVGTYREDPLYPKVVRAVVSIMDAGKVVAPVEVFVEMGLLTREHLEDWRLGRVPYLERVINCNLTRLARLLRILRFHAHDMKLKPSWTAYMGWGKGPKRRLRFTKTGDSKLEEVYATHFLWPGEGPFHATEPRETDR
jgi:hypothetical protein